MPDAPLRRLPIRCEQGEKKAKRPRGTFRRTSPASRRITISSAQARASWRAGPLAGPPVGRGQPEPPGRPRYRRSSREWSRRPVGSKPERSRWSERSNWPGRSSREQPRHGTRRDARTICPADPRNHRGNPRHRRSSHHRGKRSRHRSHDADREDPRSRHHGKRATPERRRTSKPRRRRTHHDDRTPSHRPDSSSPSSTRYCTFNQPPAKVSKGNNLNCHPAPPRLVVSALPRADGATSPCRVPIHRPGKQGHVFGVLKIVKLAKLKVNSKLG